ncbi:hypothetical protein DMENIID0001_141560 [Sergentomyia squamirostris]
MYPCLWVKGYSSERSPVLQMIANELNRPFEYVQTCWFGMKAKHKRIRDEILSNKEKKYETTPWELYNALSFLNESHDSNTTSPKTRTRRYNRRRTRTYSYFSPPATDISSVPPLEYFQTEEPSAEPDPKENYYTTESATEEYREGYDATDKEEHPEEYDGTEGDINEEEYVEYLEPVNEYEDFEKKQGESEALRHEVTQAFRDVLSKLATGKSETQEERNARCYGQYIEMRFLNWPKEKQIVAMERLNQVIYELDAE